MHRLYKTLFICTRFDHASIRRRTTWKLDTSSCRLDPRIEFECGTWILKHGKLDPRTWNLYLENSGAWNTELETWSLRPENWNQELECRTWNWEFKFRIGNWNCNVGPKYLYTCSLKHEKWKLESGTGMWNL